MVFGGWGKFMLFINNIYQSYVSNKYSFVRISFLPKSLISPGVLLRVTANHVGYKPQLKYSGDSPDGATL